MIATFLACITLAASSGQDTRPALPDPSATTRAVALVGVGVAGGLGLKEEFGARVSLADVAAASLPGDHDALLDLGSWRAWLTLDANVRAWVAACKSKASTLVFAPDYLWWFVYSRGSDVERAQRLEHALAWLENLEAPLLLGDLPDLTPALGGKPLAGAGGPQLSREMLPSKETLESLRARVAEWAAAHPRVVLLPLARLYQQIQRGEAVELRGNSWSKEQVASLLQLDRVHPTLEGSILIALMGWDELVRAWPQITSEQFEWSAKRVRERLSEAKAKELAEEAARRRREIENGKTPPTPPPEPPAPEKPKRERRPG